MKKIRIFIFAVLLLGAGVMFAGCKSRPKLKTFSSAKFDIGTTAEYNGNKRLFAVIYDNEILNRNSDYEISYSIDGENFYPDTETNFVDAGSYEVWFRVEAKGYQTYIDKITYTINPKPLTFHISSITDFYGSPKSVLEIIDSIVLRDNAMVVQKNVYNITYEIQSYNPATAKVGDVYQIIGRDGNPNDNYDLALVPGTYSLVDLVSVTNFGQITYYPTLTQAVANATVDSQIKLNGDTNEELVIEVENKNLDFTIDLNGYSISKGIVISADANCEYGANIKIYSSKMQSSVGKESVNGITILGGSKFNIELENVAFSGSNAGILTNSAFSDARITARHCKFGETSDKGAELISNSTYKFYNCTFTGNSAYCTKSGNHFLSSCGLSATKTTYTEPTFNNNGTNATGSAMVIESTDGVEQTLYVQIYNGTFISVAGHGIEECVTGEAQDYATVEFVGIQNYSVAEDKEQKVILTENE